MPNAKGGDREELRTLFGSFPYSYSADASSSAIRESYSKYEGKTVSVAGRVMAVRKAGKLLFIDIADRSGRIQLYFDFAKLGEKAFDSAKRLNAGDIIGGRGAVFKTKAGEPSVNVDEYTLLSKALRVLPDKWHGVQQAETRYRKRYLDLIMSQEAKDLFIKRSMVISSIRAFLDSKGYLEFETPVVQPLYAGDEAAPFKVHVNTLNEEHYLRISNELYLKRLIIGGMEKVYEVYKAFRNEDIDSTHSPEFTMIEFYEAYVDYNYMMALTEEMVSNAAKAATGSTEVKNSDGNTIKLNGRWKRISYTKSISDKLGFDIEKKSDEEVMKTAEDKGIKFEKGKRHVAHAYDKLFGLLVQPDLVQPTFVIDFPKAMSPLAKEKRGNPKLTERFELYIDGMEIANSYSELNNPIVQRENFEAQGKVMKEEGEKEQLDFDFVEAMETGMPPTGGCGIGIDRLVMVLTGKRSIKEVILFPMEKRGKPLK
ncbi:MAG: lysine--tRNA ligase [Candidatus Micrarchaeota archaeon]|nr:lysine--tRNA ligase [Candidatus Micrarchaeota archaeon]